MAGQRSVMKHDFSKIPKVDIPRSSFDRSHGHKTTFDGGWLIPILVDEALPGDTFTLNMTALARLATPLRPVMDNMYLDTFFFAVPMRLLWDNWEKFNGAQEDPGDSIDFTIPTNTNVSGVTEESLADYMGIPPGITNMPFTMMPFRAYNLIWNEWFRDENIQDSAHIQTDDAGGFGANYFLRRRGKRHDYFTSCLPWPQKGDAVELPLGGTAPVTGTIDANGVPTFDATDITAQALTVHGASPFAASLGGLDPGATSEHDISWDDPALDHTLVADLSSATLQTINAIRQAFQIQKLLERDARGGTRYTEIVRSHFGVTSPDSRMQRPEYLGGGSTPLNITPIGATTSNSFDEVHFGDVGGFGTAVMRDHAFTQSFTEHCVIIGLISARADLTYQQGLNKMFTRQTRYDFYWPTLSHIGEQSVLNGEIFAQGTAADALTFGYQERYAEYRYKPSLITGLFRSGATGTLDVWHLSQDFSGLPLLNASFIEDTPPIDRIIAAPTEPHFLLDCYFNMRCARPMPMYGVPGMIDHF